MKRLARVSDLWIKSLGIMAQGWRMQESSLVCAFKRAAVVGISVKRDWKSAEASTNPVA